MLDKPRTTKKLPNTRGLGSKKKKFFTLILESTDIKCAGQDSGE